MKILVMNGPNLNMLGQREPEIYGHETLDDINKYIVEETEGADLDFFQSNFEGELIEKIHHAKGEGFDGIVYNPGAHTHYSYALHDAIKSVDTPVIEVHLSDIKSREKWREKSVLAPACEGQIWGKGKDSYVEGVAMFVNNTGDIFYTRSVKTPEELVILQEAQNIADAAFNDMLPQIHVGMKETEVRDILEAAMKAHGAEGFSFETLVGTGANGANIHAMPGENVLAEGDAVVIDFGCMHKGYCSDTTRTVFCGAPTGEMLEAWNAVKDAHETVARELAIGKKGIEMHDLANSVLVKHGFKEMPHGLGHGVGHDIHEKPTLNTRGVKPLEENNVITDEPGIYVEGKFGIRLEDCGVLTKEGFKPFTKLTHDLIII